MSDDFFRTVMGRRFYEGTMPRIAEALKQIADNLDRIATHMDKAYAQGYADAKKDRKNEDRKDR